MAATGNTADQAVDLGNIVPVMAKTIHGIAGVTASGAAYGFTVSPGSMPVDPLCGGQSLGGAGHTGAMDLGVYYGSGRWEIPNWDNWLMWRTHDTAANKRMDVTGWTL